MAEQPGVAPIKAMQRQADEFAHRQHEDVFKRFELLLERPSKCREDDPVGPSQES